MSMFLNLEYSRNSHTIVHDCIRILDGRWNFNNWSRTYNGGMDIFWLFRKRRRDDDVFFPDWEEVSRRTILAIEGSHDAEGKPQVVRIRWPVLDAFNTESEVVNYYMDRVSRKPRYNWSRDRFGQWFDNNSPNILGLARVNENICLLLKPEPDYHSGFLNMLKMIKSFADEGIKLREQGVEPFTRWGVLARQEVVSGFTR